MYTKGKGGAKPKGCLDKHHRISDTQRKQLAMQCDGITPLEFACSVLRDDESAMSDKRWACELLMPYMHRRLPVAVEMSGGVLTTVVSAESLAHLSITELSELMTVILKVTESTSLPAIEG